jgi:hypothetical protein
MKRLLTVVLCAAAGCGGVGGDPLLEDPDCGRKVKPNRR